MSLVPSKLKFTLYFMDKFTSFSMISERFDFKARAYAEDLESRRDWQSNNAENLLGDVFVLEPLEMRGKTVEITIRFSWGPCFAIIRWNLGDCCLHVAVRPSPPYRTWVKDHLAPVTWQAAVNHSDRVLDNLRTHRTPKHEAASSSTNPPKVSSPVHPKPPCPQPPKKLMIDDFSQTCEHTTDQFCQTTPTFTRDFGVGPDLIHLETSIVGFRSVEFYHPPWPVVWVTVFGEFGMIHGTLWTMPVPNELDVAVNQFPPETTHEIIIPEVYEITADLLIPVHPRRPNFRPPPPLFPRPDPPVERPGVFPVPPGIRAVYTTGAALLRSQPEMNHPRRSIAPRIRNGAADLENFDIVGIARRWARLLDTNPEINPSI